MDAVINTAVEEICAHPEDGITLPTLWAKLQGSPSLSSSNLHLSPLIKTAIWTNLLRIPTLRFEPQPSSSELQDAENLNLKIFPQKTLAHNFIGLYDSQTLQQAQMRVLQLLADAKTNGITQSQLSKQLHIDGNNFHYVMRSLECQGLIVKHSAVEKKKQVSTHGEPKYYPRVTTHLVYLHRYAKHAHSHHQKFEFEPTNCNIAAEDEDEDAEGTIQTDVFLRDYAPQLKAICDKLGKAKGKVLVVSDIKKDLGYCGSHGKHRAWRAFCGRLKADNIVEQFEAEVNGKIETCLRLLDPTPSGSVNDYKSSNSGKMCAIDQFVELPIEHQIFDTIDAAGPSGITLKEICERLAIDLKKSHMRLVNLCYKFGMKVQEEPYLKSKTYRVWTSRNFNPESEVSLIPKPGSFSQMSEFAASTFNVEHADPRKLEHSGNGAELSCDSPRNIEFTNVETRNSLQELALDQKDAASNSQCDLTVISMEADVASSVAFPSNVSKPFSTKSSQRCTSSSFTANSSRRANRILERLKDEGFILRSEISRWLSSFEEGRSKNLDRKTIDRILTRLQEQGLCKCITVHSPVVTEYSKTKDWVVVVHSSISLSPKLFEEIQDRVRSFSMEVRIKSSPYPRNDEFIPVLEDIQKSENPIVQDGRGNDKTEAMRANGFVIAKMIRAKLLHSFLWDHLHGSASHIDAISPEKCTSELTNSPHSSNKLFSLEAAMKAIPVELFLQVVGSTKKYEELVEKCRTDLRLSDLPPEEYKCLMDTHATGRLSKVIDILRRLKLIRIVTDMQSRDGVKTPYTFTHMMELKPYIEEPVSNEAASLNFISFDLRPRIRHDFILSSQYAVDEYWQTLEYCYAAANKRAASYAFPGSVVPELFRYRSWASTRLMTTEQRAELLKRVTRNDLNEKISYRDCEKIAKDLNLTLEQVLSVYSCKRRDCLKQSKDEGDESASFECRGGSSRSRDRDSTELRPAKLARIEEATDGVGMHLEEQDNSGIHSGEDATYMQGFEEDDHYENSFISRCVLSKIKPKRQRRFLWSDETDRQLIIQYVRHRAALGAKYHRIDWASLSNLPAPPRTCMRRMNLLNADIGFRKAVNRLCNMLSGRYAKQLGKYQNSSSNNDDCTQFVRPQSSKGGHDNFTPDVEIQRTNLTREVWDDFEDKSIRIALDEVFRCKRMAKLDASSKKGQPQYEGRSDANADADGYESQVYEEHASAIPSEIVQSSHGKRQTFSSQRSCRHHLDKNLTRFLNNEANVYGQVYKSLAVSNAVELFKLVFLSTSTGLQAPSLLADILRHYSEHDLFAAFNCLREKKVLIGGNGSEPFELSQQFLHSVSKSPFPFNTGKRAVKFSAWLQNKEKELTEMGTNLTEDLQCGDIFHLFALVSSGELSITPCLPDNGVGEAEDLRNTKRKSDVSESSFSDKAKKHKSLYGVEGEIISRREKGFPGIIVTARRASISRADILDSFKDNENSGEPFEGNFQLNTGQSHNYSPPDHMPEILNSCDPVSVEENNVQSPWEAMADYARRLMSVASYQAQACSIRAEIFRVVYAAIQKSGDQGLSMEEISQVINLPGAQVDGLIVDVLQAFGQAFKVNAYDSVRVVDSLYRHKYFLTPKAGKKSDDTFKIYKSKKRDAARADILRERKNVIGDVHKVTILNLPQEVANPESQACNRIEGSMQDRHVLSSVDHVKETLKFSSDELCVPILPWINGDGSINNIVYRGLSRRALGIVMQNPGILEDDIVRQMHVLNPQSCRTLLELMVLDKHLIVRKMHQRTFEGGSSMLQNLIGSKSSQSKWISRDHFFANPMSTGVL